MKTQSLRFLKYFLPKRVGYNELQEIIKSIIEERGIYELTERQVNKEGSLGNEWDNTKNNLTGQNIIDNLSDICSAHLKGCSKVLGGYVFRATPKTIKIGYCLPGVDTLYSRKVDITRTR